MAGQSQSLRYDDSHAVLKAAFAASTKETFRVVEYSVQSNHLHLLVEAQDARSLSKGMLGLSVRIASRLNRLWRRAGKLFADRYHARLLRSPSEVRRALVYVLQNARKHGAWIARVADAYSSGPSFDGWRKTASSAESRSGRLARARTWLLTTGWRRLGLLGLFELPRGALAPLAAPAYA